MIPCVTPLPPGGGGGGAWRLRWRPGAVARQGGCNATGRGEAGAQVQHAQAARVQSPHTTLVTPALLRQLPLARPAKRTRGDDGMPATGRRPAATLTEQLAASAPKKPVNNNIALSHYYRSLDLLLSQARTIQAAVGACKHGFTIPMLLGLAGCSVQGRGQPGAAVCHASPLQQVRSMGRDAHGARPQRVRRGAPRHAGRTGTCTWHGCHPGQPPGVLGCQQHHLWVVPALVCSLVYETLPQHKHFARSDTEYARHMRVGGSRMRALPGSTC